MIQRDDRYVGLYLENLQRVHDTCILNQGVRQTVSGDLLRLVPAQIAREEECPCGIHGMVTGGDEMQRIRGASADIIRYSGLVTHLDVPGELPGQRRIDGNILDDGVAEGFADPGILELFPVYGIDVDTANCDIFVKSRKSAQDLFFRPLPTGIKEAGLQTDLDSIGHVFLPLFFKIHGCVPFDTLSFGFAFHA